MSLRPSQSRDIGLPFEWPSDLFADLPAGEGTAVALFHYKRSMAGIVWDAAQLEGNPFTFAEVQTLMDGVTVGGRKVSDEAEVRGLIDSTQYLHDTVRSGDFVETITQAKQINSLVAKDQAFDAGMLRGEGSVVTNIGVDLGEHGRFDPTPSEPGGLNLQREFNAGLEAVSRLAHPVERAIATKCVIARGQYFYDGNKRTSRHMMNGILLSHGYRAVSVPARQRLAYNKAMVTLFAEANAQAVATLLLEVLRAETSG